MSWFREETNGVLFATRSFFTGASFEGDTCRLVVIDKLPFPVPTEPVFEARCEEIVRRGGDSFGELTIPMMTLPLQQGFGRLIRTKRDRGVVAILDPRLKTKGYGAKIVRSLPPATMATDISAVERFFNTAAVV
jgi:ATP-dependent DNA helicase DinG